MEDYLHDYFIPNLFRRLDKEAKASCHCCGMCRNWDEYKDWSGYGDCKRVARNGLGFDCDFGKTCAEFYPALEIEVGLHVHDKRIPEPIKVVW